MKMAKASPRDMDAALDIMAILQSVDSGWYPPSPKGADDENDPDSFDEDDPEHLRAFFDRIKACMDRAPGCVGRVIGGFHVVMTNDILDPDDDCLALNPRFKLVEPEGATQVPKERV